ncbi:MAG: UvrB/UvrC motif-containing protein [Puniceicoccales bacterium]|nr:UvrB/UvrC motif-containing protein [Puniceicoccales bacterium]
MKKCQFCGKPATVHFTQIINSEMQNVDLCDECATKHGLFEQGGSPLSILVALGETMFGNVQQNLTVNGLICSSCGCTPIVFKETGRLGCENCYRDLKPLIEKIIESFQKGMCHVGKRLCPSGAENNNDSQPCDARQSNFMRDVDDLKLELERAVTEERYEDAAILRDEIKNIRDGL